MLDIEKIRQLIEMMVLNDVSEMTLREGDLEVKLRRPNTNPAPATAIAPPTAQAAYAPPPAGEATAAEEEDVDLVPIKSPMVGTFYAAPDPESAPYVQPGSTVGPGTVVCVLEAMKVFSEIKAELAGVIERILVKNADAVEFGQPLFLVRPTA